MLQLFPTAFIKSAAAAPTSLQSIQIKNLKSGEDGERRWLDEPRGDLLPSAASASGGRRLRFAFLLLLFSFVSGNESGDN